MMLQVPQFCKDPPFPGFDLVVLGLPGQATSDLMQATDQRMGHQVP
jgi:hypothetical protein